MVRLPETRDMRNVHLDAGENVRNSGMTDCTSHKTPCTARWSLRTEYTAVLPADLYDTDNSVVYSAPPAPAITQPY